MIILNQVSEGEHDTHCPHCNAPLEIKWDTEYGDPIIGDYSRKCPKCDGGMSIGVDVQVIYTASKLETT